MEETMHALNSPALAAEPGAVARNTPRAGAAAPARTITPRSPELDFDAVPRYWVAQSALATHLSNGVNMLFPAGERFFVRSVRHYLDRLDDEALRAQVKAFFGQEGRHARAHERQFDVLRAQGYDVDGFLAFYEPLLARIEAMAPAELRLSVTVALEHYTAIMAHGALTDPQLAEAMHPAMARLLQWHAAEEIEHKSVAFDVLARVNPSYGLRLAGMGVATLGLAAFWIGSTSYLLLQDKRAGRPLRAHDVTVMQKRERSIVRDVFATGIRAYLRRDFHPNEVDDYALAAEFLVDSGIDEPPAAHA
jgi:predicted metal-dependent hydrolase